ncbi:MAG: RedB protein [Myxococcota bacterium]
MKALPKLVVVIAAIAWFTAIVFGGGALLRYSATGGRSSPTPAAWPVTSKLPRDARTTMVMFAHPFCACTQASLAELDRLLTKTRGTATVVFLEPLNVDESWRDSRLIERARGMQGVTVVFDDAGHEASLFGAETSGHVVVYDAGGALRYSGGITQARGHEGWSAGQESLASILGGSASDSSKSPIYGCALTGSQEPEFADKGK